MRRKKVARMPMENVTTYITISETRPVIFLGGVPGAIGPDCARLVAAKLIELAKEIEDREAAGPCYCD